MINHDNGKKKLFVSFETIVYRKSVKLFLQYIYYYIYICIYIGKTGQFSVPTKLPVGLRSVSSSLHEISYILYIYIKLYTSVSVTFMIYIYTCLYYYHNMSYRGVGIYQKNDISTYQPRYNARHTNRSAAAGTSNRCIFLLLLYLFFTFYALLFFSLVTRLRCPLFISPLPSPVGYYIYRWHFRRIAVLPSPTDRTTAGRDLDTMCDLCFPLFTGARSYRPPIAQNIKRNIRHTIMIYNGASVILYV